MAISKGYEGTIYAGSSVSDSEIAHINNWEINFSGDALENTAFGDGVYDRTYQPGLRAHTISFSGYSDPGDNSHSYLLNLQRSGTEAKHVFFKAAYVRDTYSDSKTSGAKGWDGEGVVTGLTISTPVDGLAAFSGTVQVTGGLATST